jgi:hypothetical protein
MQGARNAHARTVAAWSSLIAGMSPAERGAPAHLRVEATLVGEDTPAVTAPFADGPGERVVSLVAPNSGFFDLRKPVPDVAVGHTKQQGGEWLENTVMRPSPRGIPAGGSYSSARDLLLFDRTLRAKKLLNDEWTRWWFDGDPNAEVTWAGGSPGVNAAVSSNPTWTVVVLTNIDPPLGEKVAPRILQALR